VDVEELEAALSRAGELRGEEIQATARAHAEKKKELAVQYAHWDRLTEEIGSKTRHFEEATGRSRRKR